MTARDSRRCSRCLGSGSYDDGNPSFRHLVQCSLCDGTGRRPKATQISYKAFLSAQTVSDKLDELVLLFTRINHSGARTELSTFLMLPSDTLFHIVWDRALELELIKLGSPFGTAPGEFYLADNGKIRAFKLGRVWSTYGWRSVLSTASGVREQVVRMTNLVDRLEVRELERHIMNDFRPEVTSVRRTP